MIRPSFSLLPYQLPNEQTNKLTRRVRVLGDRAERPDTPARVPYFQEDSCFSLLSSMHAGWVLLIFSFSLGPIEYISYLVTDNAGRLKLTRINCGACLLMLTFAEETACGAGQATAPPPSLPPASSGFFFSFETRSH